MKETSIAWGYDENDSQDFEHSMSSLESGVDEALHETDARQFQQRVEDAATSIQQRYRGILKARNLKDDEDDHTVTSSTQYSATEYQDEDEDSKKYEEEEEDYVERDWGNLVTLLFVGLFGVGMLVVKVLGACCNKSNDVGGVEQGLDPTITTQGGGMAAPVPPP